MQKKVRYSWRSRTFYCMSRDLSRQAFFETWVDGVARHIPDPVQRLRFVRVAGPCKTAAPPVIARRRVIVFPAVRVVVFLMLASVAAWVALYKIFGPA